MDRVLAVNCNTHFVTDGSKKVAGSVDNHFGLVSVGLSECGEYANTQFSDLCTRSLNHKILFPGVDPGALAFRDHRINYMF